jgi:hypothetical protein
MYMDAGEQSRPSSLTLFRRDRIRRTRASGWAGGMKRRGCVNFFNSSVLAFGGDVDSPGCRSTPRMPEFAVALFILIALAVAFSYAWMS